MGNDMLRVCRVLDENDDFLTIEVAKHNDVTFNLNQGLNPEDRPDEFYFVVFIKSPDGTPWKPWENE